MILKRQSPSTEIKLWDSPASFGSLKGQSEAKVGFLAFYQALFVGPTGLLSVGRLRDGSSIKGHVHCSTYFKTLWPREKVSLQWTMNLPVTKYGVHTAVFM